ncbi:MAG: tetratricopeptide repeat protein [Proteobacteria bacterium]|nr:tetratricopeptide repeat protein [Pseudomonadota bacterium]
MRKSFFIFFLLLVSACGFNRPEDQYFKEAVNLKNEGDLGNSIDIFKKVIATAPRSDKAKEALYLLGDVYYQTGEAKKAIKVFKAYLDLATPRGKRKFLILNKIGTLYYQKLGDPQQGLGYYVKALDYAPSKEDRFDVLLNMGDCYFKMYRFDMAVEYFNKAVMEVERSRNESIIPKIQEALYYMAFSYSVLRGDISESELSKRAVEIKTPDPLKKTIEILDKCIKYSDKSKYGILCKFEKAEDLVELDEKDKALAIFMELRDSYPNKAVIEAKIKKLEEDK